MSRKYCEVCGVQHDNGSLGFCDYHLEFRVRPYEDDPYGAELDRVETLDELKTWLRDNRK
jgi:hypothetical protein